MNSRLRLLNLVAASGALLAASSASGQFLFNLPENGSVNTSPPVSVTGTVNFDLPANKVTFTVTNDSAAASEITAAYLLKPFDLDGTSLDSVAPEVETNVNKQWKLANEMGNDLFQFMANGESADDFTGADDVSPSSPDTIESTPTHETTIFTFTVAGLSNYTEQQLLDFYADTSKSHIAFRWQTVDGNYFSQTSAKGFGFFTPVPEPSQIAGLSVLGLGGLLFIRRRLKARRSAKN